MLTPAQLAIAVAVLIGEPIEEVREVDEHTSIRDMLHDKQREFLDCSARLRCVLGGRQGGKSFVFAAWLFDGAFERPRTVQTYLGLTQDACRDSVWPEMLTIGEAIGLA